jgi:hypothetical protein
LFLTKPKKGKKKWKAFQSGIKNIEYC